MLKKMWIIFINCFTISMTANSGYAMFGVMKNRFAGKYGWVTEEEMEDYLALAQSSPGPVAVNSAVQVGQHVAGLPGVFSAVMGIILPPFLIMLLVTYFYTFVSTNPYVRLFIDGMQAGVCAMLLDIMLGLFKTVAKRNHIVYYLLIVISFLYVRLTKYSIFYLAVFCVIVAIVKAMMSGKGVRNHD